MPEKGDVAEADRDDRSVALPGGFRLPLPSPRLQSLLLGSAAAIILLLIVLVALAHLTDRHRTDHVAGAWMALTRSAQQGVYYPPLFDGERFGGTRWMPLSLVYNLLFAQLSTDLMTTGKLASLASWGAVIGLTYSLLRTLRVERSVALALLATAAVSDPLLLAVWAPFRGDTPALALQLGALLLVLRAPPSTRVAAAAGLLCALALLCKASAGWAPIAIGLLYLSRSRRSLAAFVATYAIVVAGGVLLFDGLSEGRMVESITSLSSGGITPASLAGSFGRLLYVIETEVPPLWILCPLAAVEAIWSMTKGRLQLLHLSLGAGVLTAVVMFADPGVASNHLVDLVVLSAAATGALWVRLREAPPADGAGLARTLVVASLLWGGLAGVDLGLADPLADLGSSRDVHDKAVYDQLALPHHRVLSEDPALPVHLGQHPTVLDAFMWRRIVARQPSAGAHLVERVRRQEFDRVVLLMNPEVGLEEGWYGEIHFDRALIQAVQSRYRRLRTLQGFWVYEPAR